MKLNYTFKLVEDPTIVEHTYRTMRCTICLHALQSHVQRDCCLQVAVVMVMAKTGSTSCQNRDELTLEQLKQLVALSQE